MKMTKQIVLSVSTGGLIIGYVLISPLEFGFCKNTYTFGGNLGCLDKVTPMFGQIITLFSIPLLLFSLITYFLHEEVFRAWLRFAYWWVPLSIVLIFLAAGSSGGGYGMPNIFDQEFVAITLSGLFALISLILIIVKSLLLRGK